jgi:hypothetical protein
VLYFYRKAPIVCFNYILVPVTLQKQPQTFLKIYFCPCYFAYRPLYMIYDYNLVFTLINLIYFNYLFNLLT